MLLRGEPSPAWVGARRFVWAIAIAWVCTRVLGLLALTHALPYYSGPYHLNGDVRLYADWAHRLWSGQVPYRDFAIDYPPGILPLLLLPATTANTYVVAFLSASVAVDFGVLVILLTTGRRTGAVLWVVAPLALGPIFWGRLDIFVAAALVVVVVAAQRGLWWFVGAALMFAALVKLWPAALFLLVVPMITRTGRSRVVAAAALMIGVLVVPLAALGAASGMATVVSRQARRGVEVESVPGALLHIGRALGVPTTYDFRFGSIDLWTLHSDAVARLSTVLLLVCLGWLAWVVWHDPWRADLGRVVLVVAVLVVVTSKVLSPQYMLWVLAGVVTVADRLPRRMPVAIATMAALLITQVTFPFGFNALVTGSGIGVALACGHAAVIVALAAVVLREAGPQEVELPDVASSRGKVSARAGGSSRFLAQNRVD